MQNSDVTGNAGGSQKWVQINTRQYYMVIYVLQQTLRQNLHFFHKWRCYLLLFT